MCMYVFYVMYVCIVCSVCMYNMYVQTHTHIQPHIGVVAWQSNLKDAGKSGLFISDPFIVIMWVQ
jgi:hypothetical protein